MEDYQRKKLYRIHLKNISQIKNTQPSQPKTAYSSRLFNFSNMSTFRVQKKQRASSNISLSHQNNFLATSQKKWSVQKQTVDFQRQKENMRMALRLLHTPCSINMRKYKKEYNEHKKIINMHCKTQKTKKTVLYRIYDIAFKDLMPDLHQNFTISQIHKSRKQTFEEQIMSGNIFELRKMSFKGQKDVSLVLRIRGRACGIAKIQAGQSMLPIFHKKLIIGNIIVETL